MAYKATMEIFELSKAFPKEERYSLTDQLRVQSVATSQKDIESEFIPSISP